MWPQFVRILGSIMPSKAQNDAFKNAQTVRNNLFESIEQSKTAEEIQAIEAKRAKEEKKYKIAVPLAQTQQVHIDKLDTKIKDLIESKMNKFSQVASQVVSNDDEDVLLEEEGYFSDDDVVYDDQDDEDDVVDLRAGAAPQAEKDIDGDSDSLSTDSSEEPSDEKPVVEKLEVKKPAIEPSITEPTLSSSSELKSNAARIKELKPVRDQLAIIVTKQGELLKRSKAKDDTYALAAKAAENVIKAMQKVQEDYVTDKIQKPELIRKSKETLSSDNGNIKTLYTHRGWKQVLTNLLTAVLGLGVFYGIAAGVMRSFTLFPVATDSGNKINNLKKSINDLTPAP